MEVLIHLIQKGSISRATNAVKNVIEDLQKKKQTIKSANKSPAGLNTVIVIVLIMTNKELKLYVISIKTFLAFQQLKVHITVKEKVMITQFFRL